jgi:proteasome lid subunit RPN8/RPN11
LARGSKRERRSFRRRQKGSRGIGRKKTTVQLLTRINREVTVLEKKLTAQQVSSIYGKKLHLILHPFVVRGTLDNIELSRSATLCLCLPHDVITGVLQEAEASSERETIGVMLGSVERDMITVSDSIPGKATSSTHAQLSAEELARLLDRGKLRNPDARFVGWYHSHIGLGVVPSKIDLKTQSVLQQFSPSIFALILDTSTKELEAYVTQAFNPTAAVEAPKDIIRFKLPVTQQRTNDKPRDDESA